jgi:predicted DsbA family dithiol-disulfide isomerase
MGETSKTCADAKAGTPPLTKAECELALRDLPRAAVELRAERKDCDTLVGRLCAAVGEATETCATVRTRTEEFSAQRCTTILARYDEVLADVRRMEMENRPLSAEWSEKLTARDAPALGSQSAPVTLIEFSDFECPFSAKAAKALAELAAKYPDRIRVVFRQFPLSYHLHAKQAAIAALAAHQQGKFWEYYQLLFANQSGLEEAALEGYAKRLKLDLPKFRAAVNDPKLAEQLESDIRMGKEVDVQGTPTVFVNGKRVKNAVSIEALTEDVEKALGQK